MNDRPRAAVYIDGFNLYKGALQGTPYKWLNLEAWCDRMLPGFDVRRIVYCSARIQQLKHDPGAPQRQDVYWQALETLPRVDIIKGKFNQNVTRMERHPLSTCDCCQRTLAACACCHGPLVSVVKREEKGSDVNLAVQLLRDAYLQSFDAALVVSGDSDIQPSVDIVRGELGLPVFIADPRNRQHSPLTGDERRVVRAAALEASQFPQTIIDCNGSPLSRPMSWPTNKEPGS